MAQAVDNRSKLPWAVFVGVVALLVYGMVVIVDGPDEATVDLHAAWVPPRNMTVNWQIGALISGERFGNDDIGQFNLTLQVPRGTEVVILAEQGTQPGYLECQINVDGTEAVKQVVDNGDNCRVETVI